eukprot:TRINITY_DN10139_c0_g6_i1.p1 TRINITY_DN10139_c0_g6~~TRINITY_DN10139_c0_g6_i1.p1  ORF type:complete len:256 (-),score=53.05 TRINITY_DN10139_c0_g6_i1:122-889(-)
MTQEMRPLCVLFGDSITKYAARMDREGWGFLLDDLYDGRIDFLNRGHSGYNTRWAKHLFPQYFKDLPTDGRKSILFLFLGANDSVIPGQRQYVPIDEFKQNMRELVKMMQSPPDATSQAGARTIVLITPPPVEENIRGANLARREPPQQLDRSNSNTRKYADAVVSVAEELDGQSGVPVYSIDLYKKISECGKPLGDMVWDGLHLSTAGNRLLFEAIVDLLRTIPEYDPAKMGWDYPHHASVDSCHPEKTFLSCK